MKIDEYMAELTDFINKADSPKYDLLKVAIAHSLFCMDTSIWKRKWKNCSSIHLCDAGEAWFQC